MNEDESTQTLSDKVIDRANVLRFGKPPERKVNNNGNGPTVTRKDTWLSAENWKAWQKDRFENSVVETEVRTWIKRTNDALGSIGRPIGFRIQEAILAYVRNYPGISDPKVHRHAFADQFEQKIVPKVRGMDLDDDRFQHALNELESILGELGDVDLEKHFADSKGSSTGTFMRQGVTRETPLLN